MRKKIKFDHSLSDATDVTLLAASTMLSAKPDKALVTSTPGMGTTAGTTPALGVSKGGSTKDVSWPAIETGTVVPY